ncbi:MAG: ATP-binding protein [Streptosporangiaceae bacterium]|nr:ATP-binding protein [Streptosporangiaceae bacterium]
MADLRGSRGDYARTGAAARSRRKLQLMLPTAEHAVALARRGTREALNAWQLAHLEDTAVLLVSELVTNAVLHARGTDAVALELEATGTWLRMEVHDADPCWPQPHIPKAFDESGFGFILVDSLAGKWGVRETAFGKAVWAELDTREAGELNT